jgi:CHAT domain-containing protein/tetratricopeptide (TPR) repeat protein
MRRRILVLSLALVAAAVASAQPVPSEGDRRAREARALALNRKVVALHGQGRLTPALAAAEEAVDLCRRLYPPERFPDGSLVLATSLNNLGNVYWARGELTRAEAPLREALAVFRKLYPKQRHPAGHPHLAASLNNLGNLVRDRGDLAAAEPWYREALGMYHALYPATRFPNGHPALAMCLDNLGTLLQDRGDPAAGEPYCRAALTMYRKLYPEGHPDLAQTLNNLGVLLQARGDLDGAGALLREALAMRRRLFPPARFPEGHPNLAQTLGNLGSLFQARGDLAGAEPPLRDALAMYRALYPGGHFPNGHPALAKALNNLGVLVQERGDLARAEAPLREALAMYRLLYPRGRYPDGHPDLAQTLSNLGAWSRARGDLSAAEPLYRQALAMYRKLYPAERFPNGHPDLAASLQDVGGLLHVGGDLDGAEPFLRSALAMYRKLYPAERFPDGHAHLAGSLNNLGTLLLDRGDLDGAERLLGSALAMYRRLFPAARFPDGHPGLATGLANFSSLLLARGEPVRAEPYGREALAVRRRLLDLFLGGASEAEALNHLAELTPARDGYLSVAAAVPGSDAAAYAAVWPTRGALAHWLGYRRAAARAAADPQAANLARRVAQARRALAALLLARAAPGPGQAQRVRLLGEEKERLEKELARALPAFAAFRGGERSTPEDLRRALPPGGAFLDLLRYGRFKFGPGGKGKRRTACYVAFVVHRDRPVCRVDLGPAAPIDAALTAWRRALAAPGDRAGAGPDPAGTLRRLVWEPLARRLPAGTHTLWLAPDDRLTGLPWAALPGAKPGTVLLEEHALAVVPYGQALLDGLRSRGPAAADEGLVLAVGAVAYDRPPRAAGGPGATRRAPDGTSPRLRWPALPATAAEVARVRALAGPRRVRSLTGDEAGAARLLAEMPRARWLHLATHGFFADATFRSVLHLDENDYARGERGEKVGVGARNPLVLSGLVLAGANLPAGKGQPADAILTAEAVASLDLDSLESAVLSACDTGLGEVAGGEGVFGLQRAFHVAGCKNVVASLWQVDDEATAALMGLFYHGLWREGLAPVEALRQAQLTLYRHPDRIPALARLRGPDFDRVARRPAGAPAAGARAPARLWAGFVLSGPAR